MRAKYRSWCALCPGRIEAGAEAEWHGTRLRHPDCLPPEGELTGTLAGAVMIRSLRPAEVAGRG